MIQKVGESHDAQADFSIAFHHLVDLFDGVSGHVDGIVQKPYGIGNGASQFPVIDGRDAVFFDHKLRQIDGSQVAGLHGKQGLFAAGIGAFDFADSGGGVVPVDPIQKDDSRVPVFPCLGIERLIHRSGVEAAHFFAVCGV